MDFSLDDVQRMLADSIDKFVANEYDFDVRQEYAGSTAGYSAEVWAKFAELGWTAVPFSEDDGGFDGGAVELMVVMERLGRGLSVEPYMANVILAGGVLKRLADSTQKEALLQAMMAGELQTTLAFVEPQARFDIANVATTAKQDGDGWVINGGKAYVLNASTANVIIVPARTAGQQTDEDGVSMFAVAADSAGLDIRAYPTIDGLQAAEVTLSNVAVPGDALLGEAGAAYPALLATINEATISLCAEAIGVMDVLTEKTIEYAKSRVQFGVPISSFQALQHRMVDMYTACQQTRSLLMWAAMSLDSNADDAQKAVHAIKYQVGIAGKLVGEEAVQIHGGMGVTWELDVAHYFKRLTAIGTVLGIADWHLDQLAN